MLRYNGVQNKRTFRQAIPFSKKATSMLQEARYNLKETSASNEKNTSKFKTLNQAQDKQIKDLQKELNSYKDKYQYLAKNYTELENGFKEMYSKTQKESKLHKEDSLKRDKLIQRQNDELNKILSKKKSSKSKPSKRRRQDTASSEENSGSDNESDDSESEYVKAYKQKRKPTKSKKLNNTNELRSYFD